LLLRCLKSLIYNSVAELRYIIAGCNGAGKTTASRTILPKSLLVKEFVNADEIAKGLSPFNPEGVAIEAGRLMLERIKYLLSKGESFSIETTLATRSYVKLVREASKSGYMVHLIYFWLNSPQLAVERVAERVSEGGHNIPYDVILRRYAKGVDNLFKLFMDEVDIWVIYDNSQYQRERIAFGGKSMETKVSDNDKFKIIKGYVK
jgi:predicted ABC-type ATPase